MTVMSRTSRLWPLALLSIALVSGASCAKKSDAPDAAAPAQRPPASVSVASAVVDVLQENVDVTGTLEPKFSVDVKSEVTGIITAIYVTEWVPVKKGDRLARLDTRESEATIEALRAAVAQARVGEARAQREYERAQQLKSFGLITPQNYDEAKSALDAAQAAVTSAAAQIKTAESHMAKSDILSPMDGVVALRGVSVGDRVENMGSGAPMFRIVDNRVMDLTVSVPSSRLARVKIGQSLEFSTDALPGRTFSGQVKFINPSIDAASRSAQIVATVANADGALRGGAFVQGRILVSQRSGVLQVPREALLNWNVEKQTAEVFVVTGDKAQKRSVTLGATSGGMVEVASGLAAGDQVVTRGAFAIGENGQVAVAKGAGA